MVELMQQGKGVAEDQREESAAIKELRELGYKGSVSDTAMQANMRSIIQNIAQEEVKIRDTRIQATRQFDAQLKYAQQMVQFQSTLVSLADNYAMGVAASATMRMKVVDSIGQEIAIMEEQRRVLQEQYDTAVKQKNERGALSYQTQILEINNKIVSSQQRQAEQLRALRDGYVSAISSMNTASGRFTKILISQEQYLGTALDMAAATSSYTGAKRNVGGTLGGPVGYLGGTTFLRGALGLTEQRTAEGGLASAGDLAYYTGRGREDLARGLVMASRANIQQMAAAAGAFYGERVASQTAGGGAMLGAEAGAAGSGFVGVRNVGGPVRAYGAGNLPSPGLSRGISTPVSAAPGSVFLTATVPSVNVTVHWDNLDQVRDIVISKYNEVLNSLTSGGNTTGPSVGKGRSMNQGGT
jgi:hypothetical protein